ncbi:MAG: homoserine dehydrogenase [Nitrospinae bacterium]|nr:homoserine dehydrogenase [Nitrospinota bacterium]
MKGREIRASRINNRKGWRLAEQVRVIVCGFGRVGREFARLVHEKSGLLRAAYGLEPSIVGVGELNGSLHSPDGIDVVETADAFEREGGFTSHPNLVADWQGLDLVRSASADTLIETTPTDIRTGEPALSHIREALGRGIHVVSANKGPFIRAYRELTALAREKNLNLKISAAAAAALPTIDVAETCLAGAEILKVEGVLNGTTNFILSRMRTNGQSYEEALAEAQALGIAETDPTLDVEGFDTANKLALIANVCMGADLTPDDLERTGIAGISLGEVQGASAEGKIMRLVGVAKRDESGRVSARVAPELLPPDHPLAGVEGAEKGITYTSDTMDRVTVVGGKSDPRGAAAALLKDLINIYRHSSS